MALLTKQRRTPGEQCIVIGPMRRVADTAILGHRCVLPQKRSSLLRVTFETSFVEGCTNQQSVCPRIMRIVTVATGHVAGTHRMRAATHQFAALFLVTIEANLGLPFCLQHRVMTNVYFMALCTHHFILFMRTPKPARPGVICMALQA